MCRRIGCFLANFDENRHLNGHQAAQAVGTHPSRISALELGRDHNHHLATRYQTWLRTHEAAPPPI